MDKIEEITELEKMVAEDEPETAPDNSALRNSKNAYSAAVLLLDLTTAYLVFMVTQVWFYGVIWFCAGYVAFGLHHKNWERAGNNEEQIKLSQNGLIVSVVSMLVMAIAAGGVYIAQVFHALINPMWTEIGIIAATVGLFGFHAIQVARYYFVDDSFKIQNAVARAKAQAHKKIQIADAAGEVVEANERARQKRNSHYGKFGDKGAVDAAIQKITGMEVPKTAKSNGHVSVVPTDHNANPS